MNSTPSHRDTQPSRVPTPPPQPREMGRVLRCHLPEGEHPLTPHYHSTKDGWRDGAFVFDPSCHWNSQFASQQWLDSNQSRTRDAVQMWGKERVANARRAAALTIINSVLDLTDEQGEEEGEVPDLLQYLDDVARHLLTLVEDPS